VRLLLETQLTGGQCEEQGQRFRSHHYNHSIFSVCFVNQLLSSAWGNGWQNKVSASSQLDLRPFGESKCQPPWHMECQGKQHCNFASLLSAVQATMMQSCSLKIAMAGNAEAYKQLVLDF